MLSGDEIFIAEENKWSVCQYSIGYVCGMWRRKQHHDTRRLEN